MVSYAAQAEAVGFDAVFKADFIGFNPALAGRYPTSPFESAQPAAAIAARVPRIAVIPTYSVLFSEPYTVARSLSSLDWMLPGRLGWNLVTSFNGERNYGFDALPDPATRYRPAAEFTTSRALWRSWPPEARIADRRSRQYSTSRESPRSTTRGSSTASRGRSTSRPAAPRCRSSCRRARPRKASTRR